MRPGTARSRDHATSGMRIAGRDRRWACGPESGLRVTCQRRSPVRTGPFQRGQWQSRPPDPPMQVKGVCRARQIGRRPGQHGGLAATGLAGACHRNSRTGAKYVSHLSVLLLGSKNSGSKRLRLGSNFGRLRALSEDRTQTLRSVQEQSQNSSLGTLVCGRPPVFGERK